MDMEWSGAESVASASSRAFSDEAVSSFLRHDGHLDLGGNRVLVNQGDGKRNLGIYDSLSREGCLV